MELKMKNPEFRETIKEKLKGQHFMHLMGFDLSRIELGEVHGEMKLEQKHLQQFGFVHGGVTSTISDITMGFAAYSLMPVGKGVVTANLSVDYHYPGTGEKIRAEAKVDKAGTKLLYCSARIYTEENGQSKLIATARSIMAVVEK
jgi:uncharacterized protein (TIGR00369 family)